MIAKADNMGSFLEARRKDLGMSIRVLAARSGLGVATVQRALSGSVRQRLETIRAIASELGMGLELRATRGVNSIRRETARRKAQTIVSQVQGNFALEGQAVSEIAKQRIEGTVARKLLNGPNIRLWE